MIFQTLLNITSLNYTSWLLLMITKFFVEYELWYTVYIFEVLVVIMSYIWDNILYLLNFNFKLIFID